MTILLVGPGLETIWTEQKDAPTGTYHRYRTSPDSVETWEMSYRLVYFEAQLFIFLFSGERKVGPPAKVVPFSMGVEIAC